MATIKVLQLAHQVKVDGTCPILIRVTKNRKSVYSRTGYYVRLDQFQNGKVVKHPDAKMINIAIEVLCSQINDAKVKADIAGINVEASDLAKGRIRDSRTFFAATNKLLETYEARSNVAAFNRLTTNLGYLKEAWGRDLALSELNKDWIEKYANFRYRLGNTSSTVKKNLADLGVVLNNIDFDGKNHFTAYAKTIKTEPVQREKLTAKEISDLEAIELAGLEDQARDMFMFAYYCHGMRFESVATFDVDMIKEGKIYYRMNKGKKLREIEIHPKLQAIIDKYKNAGTKHLFPVVEKDFTEWTKKDVIGAANTLMNTYLKRVGIMTGIGKHIHFHMARHSFATIALQKGVGYEILKDALGHSKFTTTQGYLKSLSDDHVNDAVRKVFD